MAMPLMPAYRVNGLIDCQSHQPGAKLATRPPRLDFSVGFDENILRYVQGLFPVRNDPVGDGIYAGLVSPYQLLEGPILFDWVEAFLESEGQLFVR